MTRKGRIGVTLWLTPRQYDYLMLIAGWVGKPGNRHAALSTVVEMAVHARADLVCECGAPATRRVLLYQYDGEGTPLPQLLDCCEDCAAALEQDGTLFARAPLVMP